MTFVYIATGLTAVLEGRRAGTYHLSGSESIDYARFCACLGERLGISGGLVEPVTSDEAGVRLFFRPRCGALGMTTTERRLGLKPQPPGEVLDSLVKELKGI